MTLNHKSVSLAASLIVGAIATALIVGMVVANVRLDNTLFPVWGGSFSGWVGYAALGAVVAACALATVLTARRTFASSRRE